MGSIPKLSVMKGESTPLPAQTLRLQSLVENNAKNYPQHLALIYPETGGKTWSETYSELNLISNRLSRGILDLVGSSSANQDGDYIVAVSMPPSHRLVELLLAIWKAGAAYLPIDHHSPVERTRHILKEAKPVLLVTDKDGEKYGLGNTQTISFDKLEKETTHTVDHSIKSEEMLPSSQTPIAIVLYTSGSTGIPKGVRLTHGTIFNRLQWQWKEFPYRSDEETTVFKTALTFVDSVSEIWGPILHHRPRTVLVLPREVTKDPHALIKVLGHHKIQRLVLVPTLLRSMLMYMRLATNNKNLLEHLRLWVCSGESLAVSLAQQFLETFKHTGHVLCNFYGSTEVMGDVTYHIISTDTDIDFMGKVPIGIPVDNTTIYLLDNSLRPVVHGELGEIFASGRNLASGYVNKRDPHRFIENPLTVDPEYKMLFRTGDYARLQKGVLVFEGRTDSQVKVRGHRVDLAEVEAALGKISGIKKAVVLCYRPAELNQAIVGFVLPEDNSVLFDKDVEVTLQSFLPPYAIPQIIIIDNLPLLVNGKVDRQWLLKHYEQLTYNNQNIEMEFDLNDFSKEKRPLAEILFKTVASVLGTRGVISSTSNFYCLGGNSLNSVYTVTLLRDQGYVISISDFISAKTLGDIVNCMRHESESIPASMNQSSKFSYKKLDDSHQEAVIRMVTESFLNKAELERWLVPMPERKDYKDLMMQIWAPLVEKKYSFVVISETGKLIGVSMNFDAYDEPEVHLTSKLDVVFNFLEYLEGPIRERKLPKGVGKILHSFMMATDEHLTPGENVEVMEYMERINLKVGKEENFTGIFTTNTSPLTQQLGADVFNYTTLHCYQVNQYVAADGSRPFKEAPNDQLAVCSWKML